MWTDKGIENKRTGKIVGLAGLARTGKDTVGKILVEDFGFTRLAFADKVREGLYKFNPIVDFDITTRDGYVSDCRKICIQEIVDKYGWEVAKNNYPEIRRLLQNYGTEAGRNIFGESCWIDLVIKEINENPETNFVITDIRFPNELGALKKLSSYLIQLYRLDAAKVGEHSSEVQLTGLLFDNIINNNSDISGLTSVVYKLLSERNIFPIDKQ